MNSFVYGFRHVLYLIIGSIVGWALAVKITLWILSPPQFGFVYAIFWGVAFFIFICTILIRMNWEMKITIWNLLYIFLIIIAVMCFLPYDLAFFE